jgi:hypothetical protein
VASPLPFQSKPGFKFAKDSYIRFVSKASVSGIKIVPLLKK